MSIWRRRRKHFPHLSEQIASQVVGRDLPIVVTQTTRTTHSAGATLSGMFSPTAPMPMGNVQGGVVEGTTIKSPGMDPALLTNTPITPEASKSSSVFRLLLFVLIVAVMMYFVFFRR